jgi:hypothetical protein
MGAHKKPTEIRELHGTHNRNKHRDNPNQPKAEGGIGPAPKHFTEQQVECWDYLVGCMFIGVMGKSDRPTMEMMSVLFHRFRYGEYDKEAVIPALNGAELSRLDSLLGRYGMTPSDRSKIVVPKEDDKNEFENL